jgi:hypothetical protein
MASRSRGTVLLTLNLCTTYRLSLMSRLFYSSVKSPQYLPTSRLDGFYSQSGHFAEEKNLLTQLGFKIGIAQPRHYKDYAILAPNRFLPALWFL